MVQGGGGFDGLSTLANADPWLVHRGRFLDVTFLLRSGEKAWLVRIHRGRVEAVDRGPFVMPRFAFALQGSEQAWATFWQRVPPPGGHDLIAMLKTGALTIAGDLHPFFANLRYFKDLLALPRHAGRGGRA
jgi:hypothetical protein